MKVAHKKAKGTIVTTPVQPIQEVTADILNARHRHILKPIHRPRLFALPNHFVFGRIGLADDRFYAKWEIVSDLGEQLILRQPEPKKPTRVPIRSNEQRRKSALDYYLDGISKDKNVPSKRAVAAISELEKAGDFIQISRIGEYALARMLAYARIGNNEARAEFVSIVHKAAEALSEMSRLRPKDMIPLASYVARWQLMKSTRAESSDPDHLLRAIKLGSALPLNLTKKAKWKDDYASLVAGELQKFLHEMREGEFKRGVFADGKTYVMKKVIPPLRKDTAPRLWYFAKQILLRSYPKPSQVAELAKICTSPSWQSPPSRKDQGILNAIEARFLKMPKLAD